MSPINVESRAFFADRILKHVAGNLVQADKVPITAFFAAAKEIKSAEDAGKFLAGHLHWVRGKRPRTLNQAIDVAESNLKYCFQDGLKEDLWLRALEAAREAAAAVIPEDVAVAFAKSASVGKALKEGKDPSAQVNLAKKILKKKK